MLDFFSRIGFNVRQVGTWNGSIEEFSRTVSTSFAVSILREERVSTMRDDQYVLNHCTSYLARYSRDRRHDFGFGHYNTGDERAQIREAWRFPIIDTCTDLSVDDPTSFNDVTFVYFDPSGSIASVEVTGTFDALYRRSALRNVTFQGEPTAYFATTVTVPRNGVYYYQFVVDGLNSLDPINPQHQSLDNGVEWSRFFTWECKRLVVLTRREMGVLDRLCDHAFPIRTPLGQRFLEWYYNSLNDESKRGSIRNAYRLDDSVGSVNYIDKALTREEAHHLNDYRICLRQIDRIVRQRDPGQEPRNASSDVYQDLYVEMAKNQVGGWDYGEYSSPQYFLDLVRRHAFTGAFSHPKYGGNVGAAGWAYLQFQFPFDWRRSQERPLGTNTSYLG